MKPARLQPAGVDVSTPSMQFACLANTSLIHVCVQGVHPTLDLENHKGKVTEWLDNEPVAAEVKRQFKKFLRNFRDENGDRHYTRVIENMVLGKLLSQLSTDKIVALWVQSG